MSDKELEGNVTDNSPQVTEEQPTQENVEPRLRVEPKGENNIRSLLKKSFEETNKNLDGEEVPLTPRERKKAAEKEPKAVVEEPTSKKEVVSPPKEIATEATTQDPVQTKSEIEPPAALTKEERAKWDAVPDEIKKAFIRREEDTQKGIEKLKSTYKPIEDVLSPLKPLLAQRGLTEAHAVKQLFDWHAALSNPNKDYSLNALKALAQSHGIDISRLVPQPVAQPQPQQTPAQDPNQPTDPLANLDPILEQRLGPIIQRQQAYEAEIQRQRLEAANNDLQVFSKDKPHFEQARYRMAEILQTAAQFGRPVTLQEAYDEAVWSMPELRGQLLTDQAAKQEADFKAAQEAEAAKARQALDEQAAREAQEKKLAAEAATKRREIEAIERAKRANVSPRGTTPVGGLSGSAPKKPASVADTIRNVIREQGAI